MTVRLYTFNYKIDTFSYSGHIPARSFEEAQKLVPFAEVDGELIKEIPFEYDEDLLFIVPQRLEIL